MAICSGCGDEYGDGEDQDYKDFLAKTKDAQVVWEYGSHEGYGHHDENTLYRCTDGALVFASCGGCSCRGSGSWEEVPSEEEALRRVPEYMLNDEYGSYKLA